MPWPRQTADVIGVLDSTRVSTQNRATYFLMPRRLYIPDGVLASIGEHVGTAVDRAVSEFWSANEDEDTMTGHLGARLQTSVHVVDVVQAELNGAWKWQIEYAKFRGRGAKATESLVGADGIFELSLDFGYRKDSKALLFQSKIDWQDDAELLKQAAMLSTWREAAIVVNYTANGFDAYSIDSVLNSRGAERNAEGKVGLKDALIKYFLHCRIGNTDLSYDARARRLIWRDITGIRVAAQFSIPRRIRLNVEAPTYKSEANFDKIVPLDEIHNYRMQADPEEILMPLLSDRSESAKIRRRSLAMTYHPDRFSMADQLLRDVLNRRMQEVNAAYKQTETPGSEYQSRSNPADDPRSESADDDTDATRSVT